MEDVKLICLPVASTRFLHWDITICHVLSTKIVLYWLSYSELKMCIANEREQNPFWQGVKIYDAKKNKK